MQIKDTSSINQIADDIIGFFKSLIEQVMEILKKFEEHFAFTENGYNKYPVEETTNG